MDPQVEADPTFVSTNDQATQRSDSGCGEAISSSTTSLTTSIFDYEQVFGRQYHAYHAGKYPFPNDEVQQRRMDAHDQSMRLILDGKFWLAPLSPTSTTILDIGTGTGAWPIGVADATPSAQVVGVDLSPIQPLFVPPNVEFLILDVEDDWQFEQEFDLVHTQYMNAGSIGCWATFYKQAFTALRPGGWVENHELDMHFMIDGVELPTTSALGLWAKLWDQGLQELRKQGRCSPGSMRDQMSGEGFRNISTEIRHMPLGRWSEDQQEQEAGRLNLHSLLIGISGLSLKPFVEGLGWSRARTEILLMLVRQELCNIQSRTYMLV